MTLREKQILVWATDGKLGITGHFFRDNYPCSISKTLSAGREEGDAFIATLVQ